jgi:DNA-3-methyladenine glycosylase
MRIMVRLGEPLWRAAGVQRLYLEFPGDTVTVAEVLRRLHDEYPDFAAAYRGDAFRRPVPYNVYVNARTVRPGEEASRTLADGDKVYFFLPAVGGSVEAAPLPRSFYLRPTLEVARSLLGQRLVRVLHGRRLSGRISEVEAYVGEEDLASHAARGRTGRNRTMYSRGGLAYVYFIYGMHYCLNVVTEAEGYPAAILIRGLEPLEGVDVMQSLRGGRSRHELASGPARLCQALAIDRNLDGHDLTLGTELWLEAGAAVPGASVRTTPRINVTGDVQARQAPWRWLVSPELGPLQERPDLLAAQEEGDAAVHGHPEEEG